MFHEMTAHQRKHMGINIIVFGILLLVNHYWVNLGWIPFWGIIAILAGLNKLFCPACSKR